MAPLSTDYYLEGIAKRNTEVVKEIYRLYLPKVMAFVMRNNGQEEDAKDVFNLVIYQLTARLEREMFPINSTFEAYLFTACKNMWRRELKKIERRRVTNDNVKELYYVERDMAEATLEQERWELFHEKLATLSENCRNILQMFFNKLSSSEIMQRLNYGSEGTVRQRIFKCKAQLIQSLKDDERFRELTDL